jgi:hypothetical protein
MPSLTPARSLRILLAATLVFAALAAVSAWRIRTVQGAALQGTLDSTIFDTGFTNGVQLNSVIWQGSEPSSTDVRIQLATSNSSSGPWNYIGSDGSAATYYSPAPGVPAMVTAQYHTNYRYFRYRLIMLSDSSQTATPQVDSVSIVYSP